MEFKKGFTLIEILIVISIVAILSGIFFANYRRGGKQMSLQRAASKLAQDIRRAQEMAMAAAECPPGTGCAGQIPPGYGIYIEIAGGSTSTYLLYADTQPSDGNEFYTPADDEIEEINLEEGVTISQIFSGGSPRTCIAINFKPPDPKIRIGWNAGAGNNASSTVITLQINSMTKTLSVNEAGLIETPQ